MGVYGLAWTPAIVFEVTPTPGVQVWVQGPFGAKLKNSHFSHKTNNMGVYGLSGTPAIFFKVTWTPGPLALN